MKIPQTEILLFIMRDGELCALLNRCARMSEEDFQKNEPSHGVYRPTICCAEQTKTFGGLMHNLRRELGEDVFPAMISVIEKKQEVSHPRIARFVMEIPFGLEQKFRTPYYSAEIYPISRTEVADIIEVPFQGSPPVLPNRIPMFEGGKDFLLAGFEILSNK